MAHSAISRKVLSLMQMPQVDERARELLTQLGYDTTQIETFYAQQVVV